MKPFRLFISLTLTLAVVLAFIVYLALSSPSHLVVSVHGDIIGITNVARAALQGRQFWQEQAQVAKAELKWTLVAPKLHAERKARIAELLKRTDQVLNEIYERHPNMNPSPAEKNAEALREEANEIEQVELDQILEQRRFKRIAELEIIIQILEAK